MNSYLLQDYIDNYLRFITQSLWTVSSIRSLWCHFNLSKVIFTYIYIALSFSHRITLYCVPPPSWDFVSLRFNFNFIPFHSQALSLIHWAQYALFHLTPSIICCFSLCFINFTLISLNLLIYKYQTSYTDLSPHLHTLYNHVWVRYQLYITTLAI